MKVPRTPPPWHKLPDLSEVIKRDAFMEWMGRPLVSGRYRHWDKLRHMDVPAGLTLEQWWAAIKFARMGGRVHTPLQDVRGAATFSYVLPDVAHEYLYDLAVGLGGAFKVSQPVVNKDLQDQYYVSSLMEESITSSQLEGATTTRKDAEDMLRSGRGPRDKSEQMIFNNYSAMKLIGAFKSDELTPNRIFELHKTLTWGTLQTDDEAGRFRTADEPVKVYKTGTDEVFHTPPPASELESRMKLMCEFANGRIPNKFIHPIIRSIILHFWLAYDHPFTDGNGRVARALFYWCMRRAGHWLAEFVSISSIIQDGPAKYARAFLYTETDDNDLTYFILFHLKVLDRATKELHEYIQYKSQRVQELTSQLQGLIGLNHRQRELIVHALRHPQQEYTIESHRTSHNVVYQTARRDLLDLEARGYLNKFKRGKEFTFMADTNLEQKLDQVA